MFRIFINKIESIIDIFYRIIMLIYTKIFYKNRIYILSIPTHGNLGDQAILYAENKFLKENFNDYKKIYLSFLFLRTCFPLAKFIIDDSIILVPGGGFLGTLWFEEEKIFRKILIEFKNNTIITFPQTIYFENNMFGVEQLNISKKIYSNHKKLHIFCREKYSYDFMKNNFEKCKIYLIPDIVLYLEPDNICKKLSSDKRKNVLFCIRNDKEKKYYNYDIIKKVLLRKGINKIDYTDTIINKKVFYFNRKKELFNKFNQFSNYNLVITDRLHGMVFCYITKTPCIVFENKSYKVKGLYDWLKNSNYISIYNEKEIENIIERLINLRKLETINFNQKYYELIEVIKEGLYNGNKNKKSK